MRKINLIAKSVKNIPILTYSELYFGFEKPFLNEKS